MRIAFWGLVRTPPEKRDMAAIKKAAEDAGRLFGRARRASGWKAASTSPASTSRWATSRSAASSIAGIALDIERPELKNVRAWYDRLATRPAYARHVMVKLT